MPARLNPKHDERTRAKIQTSQLINRLTKFVKGEVEMSGPQVTAALGLLKKTLPDLQNVEHSGAVDVNVLQGLYGEVADSTRDLVKPNGSGQSVH